MKKLVGLAIGVVAAVFATISANSINAEEKNMAPYIGISPVRTTMELQPGESYTGQFRVSNAGESTFDYIIEVSPYQVTDDKYTPDYVTETNYTRIKDWFTFSSESGTLEPHTASDYITFTVKVPEDIPAGGQFAIVKATVNNKREKAEGFAIENRTSAGMLIYATINGGEARREGVIIENKIPTFLSSGPLNTVTLVENKGNIYAEAKYSLKVTSAFNDNDVLYSNEDDDEGTTSLILPETRRYRQQVWDNVPFFGLFKVKQTISIFDEYSEVIAIVFICPFWLIIVVILAIVLAVLWLRARLKAHKNRY